MICPHCETSFTPATKGPGQYRRFCSENCRKRSCDDRHRASCEDCGALLSEGSQWYGVRRCVRCHAAWDTARIAERGHRIEALWAEGLPVRVISDRLGWTSGHLRKEMVDLRAAGYDLPYRYRTGTRNATKFPHLQRAA